MEGHGWSFPITRFTFQVRKVMGGWVVDCRIILSAPVPVPFLWTLDFRLWTWIWDLDLGVDLDLGLTVFKTIIQFTISIHLKKGSRSKGSFLNLIKLFQSFGKKF